MTRLARLLAALAVSAAALTAAGCEKHDVVTVGETEGIWLDVGPLDYQVQGSRQLTADTVPDSSYLMGLPQGVLPPEADETWFAVWLRIENKTDQPARTAEEFEIVDTDGRTHRPIRIDTSANPFAYEPTVLEPGDTVPRLDSAIEFNVSGAELLFKLPLESYQNRPLEFHIKSPGAEPAEAHVDLDV